MIQKEIKRLEGSLKALGQNVMQVPKKVRIKEFFPKENAVTVHFVDTGDSVLGDVPKEQQEDYKFALGYRGDVSESMSPQPGDIGFLFYTGMQYKRGFVMLSHTTGGEEANSYVPIRGSWSLS